MLNLEGVEGACPGMDPLEKCGLEASRGRVRMEEPSFGKDLPGRSDRSGRANPWRWTVTWNTKAFTVKRPALARKGTHKGRSSADAALPAAAR